MDFQQESKFKGLQTAADIFVAIGFLIIAAAVIGVIGLIKEASSFGASGIFTMTYIVSGGIGVISGIFFIGIGQLLRCFIGVYENTWHSKQLLKKQNEILAGQQEYLEENAD